MTYFLKNCAEANASEADSLVVQLQSTILSSACGDFAATSA